MRKRKNRTGISDHVLDSLARVLYKDIRAYLETDIGKEDYKVWQKQERLIKKYKQDKVKMTCPNCGRIMEIMYKPQRVDRGQGEILEVVGRCDPCDYDALWVIDEDENGEIIEHSQRRYFHG